MSKTKYFGPSSVSTRSLGGRVGLLSAAALALAYAVVRSKTRQAERDNPPAGRFVTVDGTTLHYVEQGSGPVLLMLHGNATMAEDFRLSGLYGELARDFRVIAFDRPGFGYSERPRDTSWTPRAQARLLHQALGMLGAQDYLVLGHSWGTLVALEMALEQPERVKALALLAGYYYPSVRLDAVAGAVPAIPVLGDLMRFTVSPLYGRLMWPAMLKFIFSPRQVAASFKRLSPWMALRPSQMRATAAEAALMVPSAALLEKRYRELGMPVSILAGDGDLVANARHNSARLHETLAQSELRLFPEVGHMLQHVVPADIAHEVLRLARKAGMLPAATAAQGEGDADGEWRKDRLSADPDDAQRDTAASLH